VCGGGTTNTVFCTDLTGRWLIEGRSSFIGFFEFTQDIVQRNHALEFRSVPAGTLLSVGSIDPFTGVFAVSQPVTDAICAILEGTDLAHSLDGVASASQPLFVGTGISYVPTPMLCLADSTSVTGTRCGGGTLDPGEQCDDGNGDDGDGCSSSCQTEAGPPVAEHLKCYGVKDLRNPAFVPGTIDLADEFVVNDGSFEAKKPFLFCTPVSVDGSPIVNSDAYVTCYKTQGPKLSSTMRPSIEIGDALGTLQLEVKKPRFVCLRSTKTPLP
jgi:cysteine-rich repeat protein